MANFPEPSKGGQQSPRQDLIEAREVVAEKITVCHKDGGVAAVLSADPGMAGLWITYPFSLPNGPAVAVYGAHDVESRETRMVVGVYGQGPMEEQDLALVAPSKGEPFIQVKTKDGVRTIAVSKLAKLMKLVSDQDEPAKKKGKRK